MRDGHLRPPLTQHPAPPTPEGMRATTTVSLGVSMTNAAAFSPKARMRVPTGRCQVPRQGSSCRRDSTRPGPITTAVEDVLASRS